MVTTVRCPTCRRAVEFTPESRYRPFCSERCRLIDLGAWLTEKHAIPDDGTPGVGTPGEDSPGVATPGVATPGDGPAD
jgi:endogenous inhibitor of DNA gyrase (YacG/DUF329 family)